MENEIIDDTMQGYADTFGPDVYALAPKGDYFLGEAVLLGIAGALVSSFLTGLAAAANERLEQWGKEAGSTLLDRISKLVARGQREGTAHVQEETHTMVSDATNAVTAEDASLWGEHVRQVFVVVLSDAGMTPAAAARYAAGAHSSAMQLLQPEPI